MVHGHRWLIGTLVVVALAVALALLAAGGQASLADNGIIYVDAGAASGDNNGQSWNDAYTDLQPALDEASSGNEIWVAEGTYKPTWQFDSDPRSATFQMKNGVALYGGFAGGETELGQRDWIAHPTILSGDIGDQGDPDDNSYHVFYHPGGTDLDGTAILDGFTVTGGNANGGVLPHGEGGGMYNDGCSPTLTNCTFAGNTANSGGGMHNGNGSNPELTDVSFSGNTAAANGGGMHNYPSSDPVLTNVTFSGNSADVDGGGMTNGDSSPTLTNVTFSGNQAAGHGGGIHNWHSSPTLTNCTFADNSAYYGGGMFNNETSSQTLTNCTFTGNEAYEGGGMYNLDSWPALTNCTFADNSASYHGGGMYNNYSSFPTLTNCTFNGNSAGAEGGGMYNLHSEPTLTNCTFSGNSAEYGGGGMYNYSHIFWPTLTNCILWGDAGGEISGQAAVTYSDIQGSYDGTGNIDADPLFVDAADGDLHLGPGSPCIDVGSNDAPDLPDFDFEGDDRILDGDGDGTATVDMGVDEVAVADTYFRVYLPLVLRRY